MSPSGWNEIARDAGHDEMQAAFYRVLQSRRDSGHTIKCDDGKIRELKCEWVGIERPFVSQGRLLGFADLAARYSDDHATLWLFYEIKPSIGSVGAVIRQCRAIAVLSERTLRERHSANQLPFMVHPVVYDDDPKLALLQELYPTVIAWPRPATLDTRAAA